MLPVVPTDDVEVAVVVEPNPANVAQDDMLDQWGATPYGELSLVLVHLRWLGLITQTHHWISSGDSFYGDHLMFDRIYKGIAEDIDTVAEKAVGMGTEHNVDINMHVAQLAHLAGTYGSAQTMPTPNKLASRTLVAEETFMQCIDDCVVRMNEMGTMTNGLENMLQGIHDRHEQNCYLLKRRCAPGGLT
jgi:DNA-binding ferritin-like protein